MKRIILASASPRRKELLKKIGLTFEILPAKGEEVVTSVKPAEVVEELSCQKAMEVADRQEKQEEGILILGADTIVAYGDEIMGKPSDEGEAKAMLQKLSGNYHQVYTGVTAILLKNGQRKIRTFSEKTDVKFFPLTEREIIDYINTGEPMDKAGAYGIQGIGGKFIQSVHGDYNNVVGLPIARIYQEILKEWL